MWRVPPVRGPAGLPRRHGVQRRSPSARHRGGAPPRARCQWAPPPNARWSSLALEVVVALTTYTGVGSAGPPAPRTASALPSIPAVAVCRQNAWAWSTTMPSINRVAMDRRNDWARWDDRERQKVAATCESGVVAGVVCRRHGRVRRVRGRQCGRGRTAGWDEQIKGGAVEVGSKYRRDEVDAARVIGGRGRRCGRIAAGGVGHGGSGRATAENGSNAAAAEIVSCGKTRLLRPTWHVVAMRSVEWPARRVVRARLPRQRLL